MTNLWLTAGITCLVLGVSGIRQSSRSIFPNRFVPAAIIGLAPVFWSLGWDLSRATGSYPMSTGTVILWILIVATACIASFHPEGRDHVSPRPNHPKAWRWFGAASLVMFAFGTVSMMIHLTEKTTYDWLSLLVETIALAGIYSYAFQKYLLPTAFWRAIALAYCVWTPINLATHWQGMMAGFHKANEISTFIMALAIGMPIILGVPALTCLALLRLSWFPPRTSN